MTTHEIGDGCVDEMEPPTYHEQQQEADLREANCDSQRPGLTFDMGDGGSSSRLELDCPYA